MTHLTLGIYPNGDYQFNVVRDEHLKDHIEYNTTMRPGRLLYVDGERKYDGMIKQEYLDKYDEIAKSFYANNNVNMYHATLPYR